MRKFELAGTVTADAEPQPVLPGRGDLFLRPDDWPMRLSPGAVTIGVSGFLESFTGIGEGEGVAKLDQGKFRPALVIPQRLIVGSTLTPAADHPTRGFAALWRTDLHVIGTGQAATCWAMRIVGEATGSIRLVAEDDLRKRLNLSDGMAVKLTIWEAESLSTLPTPDEIIADWCEAASRIEDDFGREKAMGYLIGEKFLNFLETSEGNPAWRQAIPNFVAEIKTLFEPWQLSQYLNTPRRLGVLGHVADDATHRMLRAECDEGERTREDARNLLLQEWAKELLLEQEEP